MLKINLKKLMITVISATMAMSAITTIAAAEESIRLEWSGKTDFSSVQGENNWYYQMNSGTGYIDMDYDSGNKQYKNSSNYITATNFHPGIGIYSSRGWKAPYSGTVRIAPEGNVRMNSSQTVGVGVYVDIMKNDECLWEQFINVSDNVGYSYNKEVEVKAGDMLYFRVGCDDYRNCNTYWIPTIKYERAALFTDNTGKNITSFKELKESNSVSCTFYDSDKITTDAKVYLAVFDSKNTMKKISAADISISDWETRKCVVTADIDYTGDDLDGGSLQLLVLSAESERYYSLLNGGGITLD